MSDGLRFVSACGVPVWSADFETVAGALTTAIASLADSRQPALHVPPVIARDTIERGGYFAAFPDLIGAVAAFAGDDRDQARIVSSTEPATEWAGCTSVTDLVLVPASCYFVYSMQAGEKVADSVRCVVGRCFRNEESTDLMRLRSFRMFEHVFTGTAQGACEHRVGWQSRARDFLGSLHLETVIADATDAFFGRIGTISSSYQLHHRLKSELVWQDGTRSVALASANYHQDHFGRAFGIRQPDGTAAHTACAAFGIERIAMALFTQFGTDLSRWPDDVASRLWGACTGGQG